MRRIPAGSDRLRRNYPEVISLTGRWGDDDDDDRWDDDDRAKAARTYAKGKPAPKGARNISARPFDK